MEKKQMFPIAWAIIDLETKVTWKWFIKVLKQDLDLGNGDKFQLKGLIHVIEEELPEAEHRRYGRHIYQAWAKKWRGTKRRKKFWTIAKSTFEAELKDNLKELSKLGAGIYEDLVSYHIQDWVRVYHNPHAKCDVVENNMCETFNSWIFTARHKYIITMMEEIRVKIMNSIRTMRDFTVT
ncbi:hypothetical protein GH714_001573 [Hevea brasiliensis]|uniref:MULE transposase domain-containing protein n=1 Tax=Hevea brasiliensis TaxID=3981 RepID=A0A6A6NFC4_HEVBR|nr:hypothetical protein GH714_001573 [Hevea brasiliensis]